MKKAILILACLLISAPAISSQRKRTKPRPKTNLNLDSGLLSEDEILFDDKDYLRLPGWRLVVRGREDSQKRMVVGYHDYYRTEKPKGKPAQAWIKYVTLRDRTEQDSTVAFEEYDCAKRRGRTLQETSYDSDGRVTSSRSSENSKWTRIIPDSLDEEFHAVICLGQIDLEESEMRQAARYFLIGRLQEKRAKNLADAYKWYKMALDLAPDNEKTLAALERVTPINPPLPPLPRRTPPP